ncbi:MAG: cytochrome c [Roseibium sp.]
MRVIQNTLIIGIVAGVAATASIAQASDDPIQSRQAIMASVGAAAGLAGGMMKGEIPYNPVAGKAAIATMRAASVNFGDYFPAGSDQGKTGATAKIWSDADGFKAKMAKFAGASESAMKAAGKDGPADLDAFKAAFGPVFGSCKACHEDYRKKN